jgi:hypothetical protein
MRTCRLFVDEVGNADLKGASTDPNVRFLSLTGVITFLEGHERIIQPRVDALKEKHFGEGAARTVVLHRREVVRREGVFQILRDVSRAQDFNIDLLKALNELPYRVITIQIDKKEHIERYERWQYDPYHYCMRCLIERYVRWMARHGFTGDVMVEARFKKVDKKLKRAFEATFERGTEHIPPAAIQKRLLSRNVRLSTKGEQVAGLQLCDLIAHPSARAMRHDRLGGIHPGTPDFGVHVAEILHREKYMRHPKSRAIEGWGTKWLP